MPTKKLTIEHPETHQAPHGALEEAVKADSDIPEDYEVLGYVNTSGSNTVYTLGWGDKAPEEPAAVVPAEPDEPARNRKAR